jgi:hypothetical protein
VRDQATMLSMPGSLIPAAGIGQPGKNRFWKGRRIRRASRLCVISRRLVLGGWKIGNSSVRRGSRRWR